MNEEIRETPIIKNNHYFQAHLETIQRRAGEDKISPKRLKQIIELVNSIPEKRITGEKAQKVTEKAGLTLQEKFYFSSFTQARREIAEALEERTLSSVDAEKWRKEFGFLF